MATIGIYLVNSFKNPLPWSECAPSWTNCIDAQGNIQLNARNVLEDPIVDLLHQIPLNVSGANALVLQRNEEGQILSSAELFFLYDLDNILS